MIRVYDTNLSWFIGTKLFGYVIWMHWWYDRGMRKRRWMPLEFDWVKRGRG